MSSWADTSKTPEVSVTVKKLGLQGYDLGQNPNS